jgi:hypothetical protein
LRAAGAPSLAFGERRLHPPILGSACQTLHRQDVGQLPKADCRIGRGCLSNPDAQRRWSGNSNSRIAASAAGLTKNCQGKTSTCPGSANSASAWLIAPFFVGAWMPTRRAAAAAGSRRR